MGVGGRHVRTDLIRPACTWIQAKRARPVTTAPATSQIPNATMALDISPEYLGVGYVIGPRIAGTMVAGGVLASWVLTPAINVIIMALSRSM